MKTIIMLLKSHVKGHNRRTPSGGSVFVPDYDNKVQKKPSDDSKQMTLLFQHEKKDSASAGGPAAEQKSAIEAKRAAHDKGKPKGFKPGDVVKYSTPGKGEEGLRFHVKESHHDADPPRVHIALKDHEKHGFAPNLQPRHVVHPADIELAEGGSGGPLTLNGKKVKYSESELRSAVYVKQADGKWYAMPAASGKTIGGPYESREATGQAVKAAIAALGQKPTDASGSKLSRLDWEEALYQELTSKYDLSRSDAQAVVEGQEMQGYDLDEQHGAGRSPADVAAEIDQKSRGEK